MSLHEEEGPHPPPAETTGLIAEGRAGGALEGIGGALPVDIHKSLGK